MTRSIRVVSLALAGIAMILCLIAWVHHKGSVLAAVRQRDTAAVRRAILAGRQVDTTYAPIGPNTRTGWTPLMFAVENADVDTVTALLESGANPRHKDHFGRSVVHIAMTSSEPTNRIAECIKALTRWGADVNQRDQHGDAIIHIASWKSECLLAEVIIELGADIEQINAAGDTALLVASSTPNNVCVIDLLLAHGANRSATTSTGLSLRAVLRDHYADHPDQIDQWVVDR